MMSDKDNNLLKSDILTVGSELSEKLNTIGVPNTFGKASEGKDNLVSIIRMTINGIDMITKDYYNKSEVNTLLNGKSDTSHNHDSAYASKNHNHDTAYASKNHNHDTAYASKSHQHDGADVILSNNNDLNASITDINNTVNDHTTDITSLNGNITSINASITDINNTVNDHTTDITSLNGNITSINDNITDINNTVNDHTTDITSLNGDIISLNNSITNLNTRVKSGKVVGISVKKQSVAGRTVTHNLGRPNVPVVTLDIGNSSSYGWGSTQATVYDVTNNDFKVKIYNNTAVTGNFSFNWVVVATD